MRETKHTPGPWAVDDARVAVIHAGDNFAILIANPLGCPEEEWEANARLVAAAPETATELEHQREINAALLKALKCARRWIGDKGVVFSYIDEAIAQAERR